MVKIGGLIILLILSCTRCQSQTDIIRGEFVFSGKLHLWNPDCGVNRFYFSDSINYLFIDCDWLKNDTLQGIYQFDGEKIKIENFRGKTLLLYNNKRALYFSKLRRMLRLKDYVMKEE